MAHRIEPFRGLLYNPERSGPLRDVIAPPYDLIDAGMQDRLYQRSPYNVVRLELARDSDSYGASARILAAWIREGVLVRPAAAAIYLYTQRFEVGRRRLQRCGFTARFRLEKFSHGRILPHERTFPKAKEDRLRLLTATETNVSSVFGLYSGQHPELDALHARVAGRAPSMTVTDDLGIENELRPIDSRDEVAIVQRALDDSCVLIADGHHRYETALEYRRRARAATGDRRELLPCDYTMMTLVACNDPGLVILPTHRLVRRLNRAALGSFARLAAEIFVIEELASHEALRTRLEGAGRGTIGVALAGDRRLRLLRVRDPAVTDSLLPAAPSAVRELDVSILHAAIFDRIFGLDAEEVRAGGNIEYTVDAAAALDAVARGEADGAFLMNPPTIGDLQRVSDAGATMPEKSTYFFPKLATGLVLNPLTD